MHFINVIYMFTFLNYFSESVNRYAILVRDNNLSYAGGLFEHFFHWVLENTF